MINPREEINLIDQQIFLLIETRGNLSNLSPFSSAAPPSPFRSTVEDNVECLILTASSSIISRKIKSLASDRTMWERTLEKTEGENE